MTVQRDHIAAVAGDPAGDAEFALDVSIVESGPMIAELMRLTDDGCGSTCETACPAESGC